MTTLNRFSPFSTLSFFRDVDSLFREVGTTGEAPPQVSFTPATDIRESKEALTLTLDLPGFAPENIDVKVEGDTLTITAERREEKPVGDGEWVRRERRVGTYARSFVLPETVEGTNPSARYAHGVLTIALPKKEEAKPRSVQVKIEG